MMRRLQHRSLEAVLAVELVPNPEFKFFAVYLVVGGSGHVFLAPSVDVAGEQKRHVLVDQLEHQRCVVAAFAFPVVGRAALGMIGDIPLIHAGDDARFGLLAGTFVGPAAILRFYVLHCVFIPVVVTVLIALHFWRIRKDGGISGPL